MNDIVKIHNTAETARPTAVASFLCISNRGELDPTGMRLLGASSKRGQDGQIGFFGTGWKYALAVLLRAGAKVRVFSGEREVVITTRPVALRGNSFQEILIDGEATGITTDVGPKWEVWMAVREFLCNAIDEGEDIVEVVDEDEVGGEAGSTRVHVSYQHVREVRENWRRYFRLDVAGVCYAGQHGRILDKTDEKTRVYRRGILVYTSDKPSRFDYDVKVLAISEERLASADGVNSAIWRLLGEAPADVKQSVVTEMRAFEAQVPHSWMGADESWADALEGKLIATREQVAFYGEDLKRHDPIVMPDAWIGALKHVEDVATVERVFKHKSRTKKSKGLDGRLRTPHLMDALKVFAKVGVVITYDQVRIVEAFEDGAVDGKFENGLIYVREGLPWRQLLVTLFHEWAHRESGEDDRTRGFEEFLCQKVIDLIGVATRTDVR